MAMRECPECGSSVKLENMKRHYANVHPGKDASIAITEEEHREIRRATRVTGSATATRRVALILVVIAIIVGAGYFGLPYILGFQTPSNFNVVTYCGGEGTVEHYHTLLVINVGGIQKEVPADIGLNAAETNPSYQCVSGGHALHTHDGSGIIHAELPVVPSKSPTLGDFFTIWGQPLSPSVVWSYTGTVTTTVYNSATHATTDYSSNPAGVPLNPSPQGPTANPYPIPQSLIWNGAYGDGASGGYYTGEIVWLNVTA
jgi:hypothetical protein